ncbi:MAG: AAA family ATPase, partial [Actinomycetota bacterium]|nr:AAA family ATPase [Actinomycetota bacterium]
MTGRYDEAYRIAGVEPNRNGHKKPEAGINPLLNSRVSLAEIIRDGCPPPDEQEKDLLIRGATHHFYGPTDQGKTWVVLWIIVRALKRGETVCYFDSENGKRITADRLGDDLGLTPEEAARLHYWSDANLTFDEDDQRNYRAALAELRPDMVVFDAWVYFLTSAGVGENDSDGIVNWSLAFLKPARDAGITTVLVDHTGHDECRARGSSRKKQEVDYQWRVKKTAPFDRHTVGEITLHREKDREAWLPEAVKFSVGGTEGGFLLERSNGTIEGRSEGPLPESARDALAALEPFVGEGGARYGQWKQATGLPKTTFERAHRLLTGRGLIRKESGRYLPNHPPPPNGGKVEVEPPPNPREGWGEKSAYIRGFPTTPANPHTTPTQQTGAKTPLTPATPPALIRAGVAGVAAPGANSTGGDEYDRRALD